MEAKTALPDNELLARGFAVHSSMQEFYVPYFAEFLGAFILTLTYVCNLTTDAKWGISSTGLMAVAVNMALFHVSGANLNPCISIAMLLVGRLDFRVACRFCVMQVLGGMFAAFFLSAFNIQDVDLGPKPGFGAGEVFLIEFIYTSSICLVFLNCAASYSKAADVHRGDYVGIAVGLCLVAGGYASSSISGTVMNPAIAIGVQLVELGTSAPDGWGMAYVIPEFIGALTAAGLYRIMRPSSQNKGPGVPGPVHRTPRRHSRHAGHEQEVRSLLGNNDDAPLSAKLMAEFVGTFFLVFTKLLNRFRNGSFSGEAWSMAAMMASMVYSLRDVSGGFFNPAAVVAAAAVSGRKGCVPPLLAGIFCFTQIFGGIIASTVFALAFSGDGSLGQMAPPNEHSFIAMLLGETIFTLLFCYVTLVVTPPMAHSSSQRFGDAAGLTVGFTLGAGNLAIGHVTGSALNPAIALGMLGMKALTGQIPAMSFVYILCELAGALGAAGLFLSVYEVNMYASEPCHDADDGEPEAGYQACSGTDIAPDALGVAGIAVRTRDAFAVLGTHDDDASSVDS